MAESKNVENIITTHVVFAMTAGAIPLPVADIVAVTAIQYDLIKQIADFHNVRYDENSGKALASSLAGAAVSRLGASAIKSIPGIGTLLGIGSQMIMAGATTYALGKIFDSIFEKGGDLEGVNAESLREQYREFLAKGKDFARGLRKSFSKEDLFTTLEKLKKLRDSGAITEEEFQKTKERLLGKIV